MDWALYKQHPVFVLAFHGCDKAVGTQVLNGTKQLAVSKNDYDWLGEGIYFWEGNPSRALQFAKERAAGSKASKGSIKDPFVIGAVLDLGLCFNLMDAAALDELRIAYESLELFMSQDSTTPMPVNDGGADRVRRKLDQATISFLHAMREENQLPAYDTVRAGFFEGGQLYPGAGFSQRAHIQIAVRNNDCIKGYFLPRQRNG